MKVLLLLASLAAFAAAEVVLSHRQLSHVPDNFHHLKRAEGHKPTRFYLALKQRNVDKLHDILMDISNPKSENYAKWMKMEDVIDMVSTEPALVDRVTAWLYTADVNNEITSIHFTGDSLLVIATCGYVESLFGVEMHHFFHERQGFMSKAIGPLTVPDEIAEVIDIVAEITEFPPAMLKPKRKTEIAKGEPCNGPPTMKALYNITDVTPKGSTVSQAAFSNYSPDGIGNQDLLQWFTETGATSNPITGAGPGKFIGQYTDGEGILDIDLLTTLADNMTTFLWINPAPGQSVWLYTYTQEMINATNPPTVNSISYGWDEADQCSIGNECTKYHIASSQAYVARTETEWMKLSTTGITFLSASGDCGVNGGHCEYNCKGGKFNPTYPSTSHYITVVGSTINIPGDIPPLDTTGWDQIPLCSSGDCSCNSGAYQIPTMDSNYGGYDSGGGFSDYLPQPDWQQSAVSNYLNTASPIPPPVAFNNSGRAYPDLAALGGNIATWPGSLSLSGGTSAASPSVAALMSLLNAELVSMGHSTLGFLNPMIYQAAVDCPKCFKDVVDGNNYACPKTNGFVAAPGWDPVTGWGSVNYGMLKEYVVSQMNKNK